jgi:hypothetical protein
MRDYPRCAVWMYHISPRLLQGSSKTYTRYEKQVDERLPSEQLANVQGKGSYSLRSTMTLLDYLNDAPFECSTEDADVVAFVEATPLLSGHDAVEEFLACIIWLLSSSCDFEVETREGNSPVEGHCANAEGPSGYCKERICCKF